MANLPFPWLNVWVRAEVLLVYWNDDYVENLTLEKLDALIDEEERCK